MRLSFTPEQNVLRATIVSFMQSTKWLDGNEEFDRSFMRHIGDAGLIGIQWPKRFGGLEGSFVDAAILQEEGALAGAPMVGPNINSYIGNTLVHWGSDTQLDRFMPDLCAGRVSFCLGYSEPEAGSDLASLRTRGDVRGDTVVITGQKQFTSGAHQADYIMCAVRTEPDSPKHAGISVAIVPVSAVEVQPLWTMSGVRLNTMFLDHVSVSIGDVVGGLNNGWAVLRRALEYERTGTNRVGEISRMLTMWEAWASANDCRDQIGASLRRHRDACDRLRILAYRLAWKQDRDEEVASAAAALKILGAELIQRVADEVLQTTAADIRASANSPSEDPQLSELEWATRNCLRYSIAGGSNEIQRNILARAITRDPTLSPK